MDLTQTEKRHYGLRHLIPFQDHFFVLGMNGKIYELHGPHFQPLHMFTSPLYCQPTHYSKLSIDPSGQFLAVGSQLPLCLLYERKTHRTFVLDQGYSAEVTQVCFSKKSGNSLMLVTCSDDATVRVWKENDLESMSFSSSLSSSFLSNTYAYMAKEVPKQMEPCSIPTPSSATFHKFPSSSSSSNINTNSNTTPVTTTTTTNTTNMNRDTLNNPNSTHYSTSKSLTTKKKRTIEEFFRLD